MKFVVGITLCALIIITGCFIVFKIAGATDNHNGYLKGKKEIKWVEIL